MKKFTCSCLVCGSGLAGLRAAKDLAGEGTDTILITDSELCSGSSFYPLTAALGSQMYDSEEDKEVFFDEVIETGATMADPELVRELIDETPAGVEDLPEIGMHPERQYSDRPACFAERERILLSWGNREACRKEAKDILSKEKTLRVMEHCDLLRVVVKNGAVAGALCCDGSGDIVFIQSPAVILCLGGFCGLYRHSLNTDETTGTGHSIALDAGARLVNMEFIQFIPGFLKPVYKLLFSETTLRHACSVKDAEGRDALLELLPENISFRDCLDDRAMHGPFTTEDRSFWFDAAVMKDAREKKRGCGFEIAFDEEIAEDRNGFIRMARENYAEYGIDLSKDRIWLAPFAHCANGGVLIDKDGSTGVPGLYAAGEQAGGVHGADRHGGMATAAAIVFGRKAAKAASQYVKNAVLYEIDENKVFCDLMEWTSAGKEESRFTSREVLDRIGELLWYEGSCIRSGEKLEKVLAEIEEMKYGFRVSMEGGNIKKDFRAFHAIRTAEALIKAMLMRRESRGPHFREDYPERNSEYDHKRICISEKEGNLELTLE